MTDLPLDVHLVSHTHWDREWYLPMGRFRQRLVALIDEVLEEPPPPGSSFLLDGQAIVLEDYLAVRPERASELAALLRERRIEAGPWYVLADELIPGAEALVRNLLTGRRMLTALRARSPRVLYCPDSFGHPAALPELAHGFGLPVIVLWRGYGSPRWPAGDFAWWNAPSGARALVHHLPRDGYEYGSHLPTDDQSSRARWTRMRDELAPRAALGPVLLTHGADHHARQLQWAQAIDSLIEVAAPDHVHASSLDTFAEAAVDAADGVDLPMIAGELRDSYGYTWTLQGTFATRAYQKRRNAIAERLLVREAEPFAALARIAGGMARRPLVDAAWKTLLQCHPHDTLCGCSIDQVARAMDARLDEAFSQGEGLRDDALLDLVGHDAASAHRRTSEWRTALIVRNAAARARGGVARVLWDMKVADVPVGPGSGGGAVPVDDVDLAFPAAMVQPFHGKNVLDRIDSPRHYPDNDLVTRWPMLVWVPPIPAYGARVLHAGDPPAISMAPPIVRREGAIIRSGELALEVDETGTTRLQHHERRAVEPLITFEDVADVGDLYTPAPREEVARARYVRTVRLQDGWLRAGTETEWALESLDADGLTGRVRVVLSLDAGEPFVRIQVRGENLAPDHRLRIIVGTGVRDPDVWADAAFGPVRRAPIAASDEELAVETPPPTAPLHRYVSLFDGARGATLYSDGLAEYEVLRDGRIAVTLVRAVGELSRNDIPERPGHAGWPVPTPEAQCLGPFECELALLLHGGARDDATIHLIESTADDVLLPLTGQTLRSAIDVRDAHGVALEGEGLAVSAIKDAADGEGLVLRCVNQLDRSVGGCWRLPFRPSAVWLARLDETPLEPLMVDGDVVRFEAAPRAVVTVLVDAETS